METWEIKAGNDGMKNRMGRFIVGVDLGGELNVSFLGSTKIGTKLLRNTL